MNLCHWRYWRRLPHPSANATSPQLAPVLELHGPPSTVTHKRLQHINVSSVRTIRGMSLNVAGSTIVATAATAMHQ